MNTRLSRAPAPSGRWALVDYFIPAHLRRLDQRDLLYKARAVVIVNILTLFTFARLFRELLPYLPELGFLKVIPPIMLATSLLVLSSMAIFRRTGSFTVAANLYGTVSTTAIVCVLTVSGGVFMSPGMTWWPILIMYIFIMGGWITALGWALVALFTLLVGMKLESAWTINVFTPDTWRDAYVSSVILCGFHLLAALWFLDFCQRQLLRRAKVERDRALFSAAHDPLTGLANRKAFQQRIGQLPAHQREVGDMEAVLMIDLDGFKQINDRHGHQAGDYVLMTIGRRLKQHVRRNDLVARLGGDEFAVLLRDMPCNADVETTVRKLYAAITSSIHLDDGRVVQVNASIGIAFDPSDGDDMETLLHHADMAMYEAKEGGHPYLFYSELTVAAARHAAD